MLQPTTGFHVASVHSMLDLSAILSSVKPFSFDRLLARRLRQRRDSCFRRLLRLAHGAEGCFARANLLAHVGTPHFGQPCSQVSAIFLVRQPSRFAASHTSLKSALSPSKTSGQLSHSISTLSCCRSIIASSFSSASGLRSGVGATPTSVLAA